MLLDGIVKHKVKKPLDWNKLARLHAQLVDQARTEIVNLVASKSMKVEASIEDAWKDQRIWDDGRTNPPFFYLQLLWRENGQHVTRLSEGQQMILGDIAAELSERTGLSVRRVEAHVSSVNRYRYMMTHPPHQLRPSSRKRGCRSKWFLKTEQVA